MEKSKCPICQGTGFSANGRICPCITGERPVGFGFDMPDEFKDIFGDMFSATPGEKKEKSGDIPERE